MNILQTDTGLVEFLIHFAKSEKVVIIYPDFDDRKDKDCEEIKGIICKLQTKRIAVISVIKETMRRGISKNEGAKYTALALINFINRNSYYVCGNNYYEICFVCSGKSIAGICSIASEFYKIKKVVLHAPKFSSTQNFLSNLARYHGAISIISDKAGLPAATKIRLSAKNAKNSLYLTRHNFSFFDSLSLLNNNVL